jgi:peroxiredoxin
MSLQLGDTAPDFTLDSTDENAKKLYPGGWKALRPYQRLAPALLA